MPNLADREWQSIYESEPRDHGSYLVEEFYVPALERSIQYDRIAGYFSSSALAVAARGIDALVRNDGEMRLIVGTELYETDRPVLEALTEELGERLEAIENERLDAQLQLLAYLLREERLQIKIAVPRQGNWEIFHPKVGVFHDSDGNALSFEGSINETVGGWERNYERFKVLRSWVEEQADYVRGDINTFERLWDNAHPFVEVYDLPEAIERDLIEWRAPDSNSQLERAIEIAAGDGQPTEVDKANIVADGALSPGGLALAEEGSTITPWPHQRVVSDTLVNTYPRSFLLSDEVGLGKTIEAGLTLSRLGFTQEVESGLLLVPASLTIQWQEELWEKFNLNAYRYDRGSGSEYAFIDAFGRERTPPPRSEIDGNQSKKAWSDSPIWRFLHAMQDDGSAQSPNLVIMSWHTARLTDRWNQLAPKDEGEVRTRDDVTPSCRGRSINNREGVWDVVVVDEAHNARKGSNFYSLLDRLRAHTQTYYFLTATPMQLHSGELYDLMTLLDLPGDWDDQTEFVRFFETRRALGAAVRHVLDGLPATGDGGRTAQSTLSEGRYQDTAITGNRLSDRVFDVVAQELDVENDQQARSIAEQRVLRACDLARDYGEHFDGYIESFEEALDEYEVDPLNAKEDEKLKYLLYPDWKAENEWLTYSRNDRFDALDELEESGWRVLLDVLSRATPVDAMIHRNTRGTLRKYEQAGYLDATVPERNPEQHKIELTDDTRRVYNRIDDYTRKFYKLAQQSSEVESRAIGFVMTTYRQRLTSSVYAISQSLQNRLKTLRTHRTVLEGRQRASEREYGDSEQVILETLSEYDLDDIDALDELDGDIEDADLSEIMPNVTDEGLHLLEEEIEELESFVDELTRIDQDPKIEQLIDDLNELDRQGHNRIIVFTQYTDTMDFIRESLISIHGETVATYSGRGGEIYDRETASWVQVGKERVKREFAEDESQVDILVCTDSASEGLNLQKCGALINYDLPWNPMRVEQRIGRIDRIGQEHEEVTILNYSYDNTVETDIYDRLDMRIGLFENVVGEMQPILSGVRGQIRSATLETEREQSQKAVERAEQEMSERIDEQEKADRVDVDESLASVEDLVEQDVIEEAKLDAWQSYQHPDLENVGSGEYGFLSPYVTGGLEAFLMSSQSLSDSGYIFTSVADLDIKFSDQEYSGGFDYAQVTYRLELGDPGESVPDLEQEGTVAKIIAPGDASVAVTFSAECADEFPSIHYLAPGNPLLSYLIDIILNADGSARLSRYTETLQTGDRPLVAGWGRGDRLKIIGHEGNIGEGTAIETVPAWRESFVANREKSNSV